MPVLPLLYRRLRAVAENAAEDTRILDAREAVVREVEVLGEGMRGLVRRIPEAIHGIVGEGAGEGVEGVAAQVVKRQDQNVCLAGYIPGCYEGLNAGPAPGAVVGIVLGSVLGFLLLLWVLFTLSSGSSFIQTNNLHEEDTYVTHHHGGHRHRSRSPRRESHRSSYREEMRQTHTSPAPAPRRDRVIRQERISRDIPRDVSRSRVRETTIVDEAPRVERRVEGDDVIEVIAEGSDMTSQAPPPTRKKGTRRSSGYRSVQQHHRSRSPSLSGVDERIESGYRRVDPNRFAGGGFRQHHV